MQTKEVKEFLGSGWAFPVTFSEGNYELNLTEYEANIEDSISIIMQTNFGEKPMEPNFGSGLHRFFFRKMDKALKADIIDVIETSLLQNEPRITVTGVEVIYKDFQSGRVEISIDYLFNQTNTRHNYVSPFYIKEGTNL